MGLLIFTVKAVVPDPSVSLGETFRGAIQYWIMILGVAIVVLLMPGFASWLPGRML